MSKLYDKILPRCRGPAYVALIQFDGPNICFQFDREKKTILTLPRFKKRPAAIFDNFLTIIRSSDFNGKLQLISWRMVKNSFKSVKAIKSLVNLKFA